jgi:ABC-2 type transport system ATP-binding protein
MSAAIEINQLRKVYKTKKGVEKIALKGIDLTVPKGSFFGLLGPNGAGKSTLTNILASTVVKTSGAASICGFDITTSPKSARRSIGIVPQELILDTFFTVYEALENTAGFYGVPPSKRRTLEVLEAVGLLEQKNSTPRSLSGGMKRRLLVAKAICHSPEVLVLDEPTAGVDVELRQQLWEYVKKLNQEGTTILLTTHYLEEAEELCDRIAVIDEGSIIVEGSKNQIMGTVDRKKLIITPNEILDSVPVSLKKFSTTLSDAGALEITYRQKETSVEQVLSAFRDAGLTIRDLSTEEPDLEEVFRLLTDKKKKL